MKVTSLKLALQTATLVVAFAAVGRAGETDTSAFSERELQVKIKYCENCHQPSGRGYHGSYPIPRLAGQQTEYFENQLRAFIEHRRQNVIMFSVAHALNPEMLTALATHFRDLNPKPIGGAPRELVSAGKKIYEEGVPAADVPACASCHGPEAKGDGVFPRLAGQLHDYTINKLTNWNKERGQDPANPDTSALMQPIAHSLSQSEIAAVAAYLNYLE